MRPDCAPRRPRASRSAISTAAAWSSASSKARAGAPVTSCVRPNCSTSCARIGAWRGQCTGCFPGVIPSIRSTAIQACRTSALGGHVEECGDCGLVRHAYNSCRNRHCPKCQGLARAEWLEARQAELLPVPYYHVVLTLPAAAAEIAFQNKRVVYAILFRAAADALRDIAADPRHLGAETGAVAGLHTWGQALHRRPPLPRTG